MKAPIWIPALAALLAVTGLAAAIGGSKKTAEDTPQEKSLPKVYLTREITPEGLMSIYKALGRPASGRVAMKVHMGEPGNKNFLPAELVRELTLSIDGTFVDCNTYYGGKRSNSEEHLKAAAAHGFTYAPVDILDTEGEISLPIKGGIRLSEAFVGSGYANYDFIVSIAHFKGHGMAGFGGTFKNLAVGLASVKGKGAIHAEPGGSQWSSQGEAFLEKVAEYAKAIIDQKGDKIIYINVLNNLSVDCDCVADAAHPQMADIGIMASTDPVALDRASVDQIYAAPEAERRHLVERIESRRGTHLLDYAERLGVGSQQYELVELKPE